MKKRKARIPMSMLLTLAVIVGIYVGIPQTAMGEDVPGIEPDLGFGLETRQIFEGNSVGGIVPNNSQIQLEVGETSKFEPEEVLEQSLMAVNASPEEDFEFDESTGTITGYRGPGGAVVIPETIGGLAVTKIYDSIFWGNPSLTSINIPGSVTSMGNYPFYGCESLQDINVDEDNNNYSSLDGVLLNKAKTELIEYPEGKVQTEYVIPGSVIGIGNNAFYSCSNLTSINIPGSVTSIGNNAFSYCSNLTSINIPGSVTSIGNYAFYYCSNLTSINIPGSVTRIGNNTFFGCDSLTSIDISNGVTSIDSYAFEGCSSLTNINIPSSVTSIGNHAFLYCESLQEINVDEDNKSYSSLDGILFDETKTVFIKYPEGKVQTEYVIPDSVTSIYYSAFKNCFSLTSIAIPNSVTDILGAAFENCPSLTSINIPNSVTGISAGTFRGCNSLTSIEIPSGVTSIGMRAFQYCSSLTSITIPSSVTSIIGDEVFSECNNLTIYGEDNSYAKTYAEVNNIPFSIIPGGIPASAFPAIIKQPESKAVLEGISITLTVEAESTDGGTLTYQWQKDGIDIPGAAGTSYTINSAASTDEGSYRVIVTNTMSGCTPATIASNVAVLTLVVVSPDEDFEFEESTGTITGYRGPGGAVFIPETIGGVAVTKIGDYAFEECSSLISIDIPGSVTSIGRYAFYNCDSLTSINIPDGVTSIGSSAFYNCFSLISINMPNGVTSISDWVFYNCMSLTSITIPNGVTKIGKDAFFNCKNLTSINIPSSVTYVDINPFRNCESLQEINVDAGNIYYFSLEGVLFCEYDRGTSLAIYPGGKIQTEYVIPSNIIGISCYAFFNCENLNSINIPDGLTGISTYAFQGCSSLTSINIPNNLKSINEAVFLGCSSLKSIYIPNSVTRIGRYAFEDCSSLTNINIPSSVTYIDDWAFSHCSSLKSIYIPNNLTWISSYAFEECSNLTSINIPSGADRILPYTFSACSSLTSIIIPGSVTSIYDGAFSGCSNLAWAKFEGNAPSVFGDYVFADCAPDFKIYYYKGATGFTNPWHGYPTEAIDGGPTDEGQNYYSNTQSKYFRVVDPTSSSYPQPSGFNISANDTNYNTGTTNDIKIDISDSYKTDIIVSKPEYHSYTFPNDFIADYNWITLYPVTVQTPFVQAALVDKSTANYKSLDNIIINNETIYENTMGTTKLYVDVNWNGSRPGTIYLKQDSKIVAVSEGFNYLTLGTLFTASGGDIFLCMKTADGTVYSQKININVYKKLQTINLDLGESMEVDVPNEVEAIGGTKLKLDFTDLSKGVIPIELDISDDGTVKGTIGLGVPDAKKKTYAFGTIKDAFQVFRNGSASDEDISKAINSMLSNDYIKPAGNYASFGIKADVHVIGYFEGNILDGRLGLTSADMVLIVKGQFSSSQVLYYGGMPFYYEAGLKTKIETGIGMEYNELLDELTARNDQSFSGNLQLFGGGGIGAPEVISGGARLTGGITMEGIWPYDSNNAVWYMDGKGSFVGTLFGQKGEWTVLQSGKLYIWENGEAFPYGFSPQSKSSLMMNDDEWSQPSREYLSSQSEFVANDMSISLYSMSGSQTISEVFKTNTYTYTDPQYVTFEDGTELLVWVDDDSNRIVDENRTALYFSYNNGSNWTEPAIVWQDNTADFNPSLKVIDETAHLIWINSNTEFIGGESLVEIAEATEIAYACFEPGSTSFVDTANISNNSGLNMLADVTVIDGAPMGVWVNNSANDVYCSSGTTSIQSASLQGSTWTVEELATELDAIDGLIINNEDNSLKVWFSQDTDSDATTTEDKEVFQLEGNTLTQYTHNDIADTKPQYANGLYWYSGGDIIFENTDTQIKAISDRFQVQAGTNGIDVITYESTNDEGDSVIYAIYNDGSGWGEPVAIVESDKYIVSYSAALRSNGSLSIIVNESTIESDDSLGNADLSFYRVIPTCNIAVNGAAYDPHSFIPDKKLDVMIDLENYGAIAVDSFDVVFMNGGTQVDTITKSMELASGQQGVLLVECQLPSIIDFEEIDITITPSNEIDDDLIDNTAIIKLRLKDISVEEVYAEKYDDTVIVTARVVNRGQTSLSNINVSLRADTEDGTLIASDSISALESQGVEIVTFTTNTLLENDIVYVIAGEQPEENILSNNSNFTMVRTLSTSMGMPGDTLGILISPQQANVPKGGTLQFSSTDEETGSSVAVEWTLIGNQSTGTSVSAAGLLTIAEDESAETLTITATAQDGSGRTNTAIVHVAPATIMYGDVNNDGSVNITDAVLVLKYITNPTLVIDAIAADVNGDENTNITDAVLILKHITNPDVPFPVEQ